MNGPYLGKEDEHIEAVSSNLKDVLCNKLGLPKVFQELADDCGFGSPNA